MTSLKNNPYNKSYLNEMYSGFSLFDTKLTDQVLEGQDAIGWALQGSLVTMTYPDAVAKVQELYTNGEETEYRGIACRRSTDGRYIADISQKEAIDELFNSSGVAEFYILDDADEQFYLPHSKWFRQMTLDTNLVNNYNEAGLPNISGSHRSVSKDGASGCFYLSPSTAQGVQVNLASAGNTILDASRNSRIYGNSDTVQPPSSNKLLYYKVGNTVLNENFIDAANVLSDLSVISDKKADKDLTNITPAQSFITEITNWCVPDYTAGVGVSAGAFIPPKNGILTLRSHNSDSCYMSVVVNGLTILYVNNGSYYMGNNACSLPVAKGVTYSISGNNLTVYFFPMKGVSQNA